LNSLNQPKVICSGAGEHDARDIPEVHHAPAVTSMLVVMAIWLVQGRVPWQQPQPLLM
jgi:hypothetical protein